MLLQEERNLYYMYSYKSLESFGIHIWFTSQPKSVLWTVKHFYRRTKQFRNIHVHVWLCHYDVTKESKIHIIKIWEDKLKILLLVFDNQVLFCLAWYFYIRDSKIHIFVFPIITYSIMADINLKRNLKLTHVNRKGFNSTKDAIPKKN